MNGDLYGIVQTSFLQSERLLKKRKSKLFKNSKF